MPAPPFLFGPGGLVFSGFCHFPLKEIDPFHHGSNAKISGYVYTILYSFIKWPDMDTRLQFLRMDLKYDRSNENVILVWCRGETDRHAFD